MGIAYLSPSNDFLNSMAKEASMYGMSLMELLVGVFITNS